MYWEQTAVMRIENKTSTFQDIKRGVRQGCVLSPDLFSLYSEIIMRNLENHPGIKVGGQNINNLRYVDDTVLIAENKEDLQKLLNIVEEESRKKGLELNSKKTKVMVISRKQESPKCDIFINKEPFLVFCTSAVSLWPSAFIIPVVINNYTFTLLSPNTESSFTYTLSTFSWTGVSSATACALRTINKNLGSKGFLYDRSFQQCTPVLWLHEGSAGIGLGSESEEEEEEDDEEEDQQGSLYIVNHLSQTTGACQNGFQAIECDREEMSCCVLVLTSLTTYQNATAQCKSLGGYLATVRTEAKFKMVAMFANGTDMWVGLDDLTADGVYRWLEDGEALTSAEQSISFLYEEPNNQLGQEYCIRYHFNYDKLDDVYCWYEMKALCERQPQ
ncbi:endonuclease-reverse transcriptase [Plakobranchus ocellatus]|uniref:Endonuclease-reverse transcriptase n=1 Tax=Plakobranchus ocellatus TaxID=259542 RepID=A0AAV4DBH4_9GAST|nr:endonuclease-reverse transcriptase [Plakobranchus ocellatus]